MAVIIAGLSGYAIGKLSFKVRGAYCHCHHQLCRGHAAGGPELGGGRGPALALTNIPPYTL
jgi:hypothetical protein